MKTENRKEFIESWFKNHASHFSVLKDEHGHSVERLMWGEADTTTYRVYYYRAYGTLMVYGDLGEAIYQWNKMDMDLEWVSNCSLDYFASKCQASEEGRGYKTWNPDRAEQRLNEMAADEAENYTSWEEAEEKAVFDKACAQLTEGLKEVGVEAAIRGTKLWSKWIRQHPEHFVEPEVWDDVRKEGLIDVDDLVYDLVTEGTYAQTVAKEMLIRKWSDEDAYNELCSRHEWLIWLEHYGYDMFGSDYGEYELIGMETSIRCEAHLLGLKMAFVQLNKKAVNA